jgi:DNA mismatch endonuclease (patch repair protein)
MPKTRLEYWEPKLARNQLRDEAARLALEEMGWRVLVVWECETTDPGQLAPRIEVFLKQEA